MWEPSRRPVAWYGVRFGWPSRPASRSVIGMRAEARPVPSNPVNANGRVPRPHRSESVPRHRPHLVRGLSDPMAPRTPDGAGTGVRRGLPPRRAVGPRRLGVPAYLSGHRGDRAPRGEGPDDRPRPSVLGPPVLWTMARTLPGKGRSPASGDGRRRPRDHLGGRGEGCPLSRGGLPLGRTGPDLVRDIPDHRRRVRLRDAVLSRVEPPPFVVRERGVP